MHLLWSLTASILLMVTARAQDPESRIVCYLSGSSFLNGFSLKNVDEVPCTHVIYSYAYLDLDADGVRINRTDKVNILELMRLRERSNNKFKALLQIGNDFSERRFAEVTSTAERRANFINSIDFIRRRFDLDGVDLHWKYPNRIRDVPNQKNNYLSLSLELRNRFKSYLPEKKLIISIFVTNLRKMITPGFNLLVLNSIIDFMNLPAYEFPSTNHQSPLLSIDPKDKENNAEFITKLYLRVGAVAMRLNLGIPLFGKSMGNTEDPAPPTGRIHYNRICRMVGDGEWTKTGDAIYGPLVQRGRQLVSYDNQTSILAKMELVKSLRLGGVVFSSMEMDDWNSTCPPNHDTDANGPERWPLIRTVRDYIEKNSARPESAGDVMARVTPTTPKEDSTEYQPKLFEQEENGGNSGGSPQPVDNVQSAHQTFIYEPSSNGGSVHTYFSTLGQSDMRRKSNDSFPFTDSILPPLLIVEAGKDIIIEDVQIQHNVNYYNGSRGR